MEVKLTDIKNKHEKGKLLFESLLNSSQISISKLLQRSFFIIICLTFVFYVIYYSTTETYDEPKSINFRRLLNKKESDDFSKLFDDTNFRFMIQQASCDDLGVDMDILILIPSAPENYKKRQMIRHTWGNQRNNRKFGNFRILFLLGSIEDASIQGTIILENFEFKDIVQGSFIDSYYNLTYKHVMGLKWHKYFCNSAKVVLKVDDDVFVNLPFVLQSFETSFWDSLKDVNDDFILCSPMFESEIIRDNGSKYFVPEDALSGDVFPPYCSGYAIFYSGPTANKIYEAAQTMPKYVNIEDAFMTGVVRKKTSVNVTEYKNLERSDYEYLLKDLTDFKDDAMHNFLIGPFEIEPEIVEKLWEALIQFMRKSDTYPIQNFEEKTQF